MTKLNYIRYCTICLLLSVCHILTAQPSNDDCENAIEIIDVANSCSDVAAYTNINATDSGYGGATCFANASNDVWFSFTAIATDATITINGNQFLGGGGSLSNPEVALYDGVCGGTINEFECASDAVGNNVIELYKGGLIPGTVYFIRVQGRNGSEGTFQLCINNYFPPVNPGSDCPDASILCDKSPFVVQAVNGAGLNNDEASGTCLGGLGQASESNSTWFSWTAATSGSLTFTLTPLSPPDDLDFVVYELPNGVSNCSGKMDLRCMASGDNVFPSPCMGPTGLANGEIDVSEPAGCNNPTQNSFLAPIDMVAGRSYALVVNNFTSANNGFSIEFGGTGEFLGPEAAFTTNDPNNSVCYGDPISFTDASTFALGSIVGWSWGFGVGATPSNATGPGPHAVTWDSPGVKTVILTVESDLGCIVVETGTIIVEQCCNDENAMTITETIDDVLCANIFEGAIDLNVDSNVPPYTYEWSTGSTNSSINNLESGEYMVTITNDAACDTVLTFTVDSPPPILIDTLITMPTCDGGQDGAVTLNVSGGVAPYDFDWINPGIGTVSGNTLSNVPIGDYNVVVTDANNCVENLTIEVRELELILDPTVQAIIQPSCFGFSDGSILLIVANGLPPYQFDWNDGNGYVSDNSIDNIAAGTFTINVLDANNCTGQFDLVVDQPTPLALIVDPTNSSCFNADDGVAFANISGGVGNYTYTWNNGQTTQSAVDLAPGDYFVTVLDGNGCVIEGNTSTIEPPELFIDVVRVEDVVCFGDETGTISVIGSGGTPDYEYSVDGFTFQTDTTFTNLGAGTYILTAMDAMGCLDSTTATISQPLELIVDAGEDQTVDLGYSVELPTIISPPFTPVDYAWVPGENSLDCTDCPRPTATPPNTTTYEVTVTDQLGCTDTDQVTVNVVKNRPIYIPNAFSPNADGFNDFFTAYGGPAARQIKLLRIFSRWGDFLFETTDIDLNNEQLGWNGIYRGKPVESGVYAYYIEIEFIDNEVVPFSGDITIIK